MKRTNTAERRAWETMRGRCYNRTDKDFHLYGGRGITVCERWRDSVETFLADMGPKPSARYQLDREDNEGNYEPDNCRWATPAQQAQNRRTAKLCAVSAVLIRYMHQRGANYSQLGRTFGVRANTARRICIRGRTRIWRNALSDLSSLTSPSVVQGCSAEGTN
jgi:hypothetical protein